VGCIIKKLKNVALVSDEGIYWPGFCPLGQWEYHHGTRWCLGVAAPVLRSTVGQ